LNSVSLFSNFEHLKSSNFECKSKLRVPFCVTGSYVRIPASATPEIVEIVPEAQHASEPSIISSVSGMKQQALIGGLCNAITSVMQQQQLSE
jgi:hypothetical protein